MKLEKQHQQTRQLCSKVFFVWYDYLCCTSLKRLCNRIFLVDIGQVMVLLVVSIALNLLFDRFATALISPEPYKAFSYSNTTIRLMEIKYETFYSFVASF
jgi:hypothetical protein